MYAAASDVIKRAMIQVNQVLAESGQIVMRLGNKLIVETKSPLTFQAVSEAVAQAELPGLNIRFRVEQIQ